MNRKNALFNRDLLQSISSGNYIKYAGQVNAYIKSRTYELSFKEKFLMPLEKTTEELIPETGNNDSFYVLGQLELDTPNVMTVNFRDGKTTRSPGGQRFKIPLGVYSTEETIKNKYELMAYDYDFFADVEQKEIYELNYWRDQVFTDLLWAVVQANGKYKTYDIASGTEPIHPSKQHFIDAGTLLRSGSRTEVPNKKSLEPASFLMDSTMFNEIGLLDSLETGDVLASDIFKNGYAETQILGQNYVASSKEKLFVRTLGGKLYDVIFCLPAPEYLGVDVKVVGNEFMSLMWSPDGGKTIHRSAEELGGLAIGNLQGVSAVLLQRGTA